MNRGILVAWALMAAINLAAGVMVAFTPSRQSDFENGRRWGHQWLVDGLNVYHLDDEMSPYPPYGIVALSALSAVPLGAGVPIWASLNLLLACLAAYLAILAVRPDITLSASAVPICMFLCWGGFRTLLQFSLVTLVLGLLSLVVAERKPRLSGLLRHSRW